MLAQPFPTQRPVGDLLHLATALDSPGAPERSDGGANNGVRHLSFATFCARRDELVHQEIDYEWWPFEALATWQEVDDPPPARGMQKGS
jgi:hypothetical protein